MTGAGDRTIVTIIANAISRPLTGMPPGHRKITARGGDERSGRRRSIGKSP